MTGWQLVAIENWTLIPEEQARPIFERAEFVVPEPLDIRGTLFEQERIRAVLAEAPWLRGRI